MLAPYVRILIANPTLIPAALAVGWRLRRRHWYRRFPFLPLPSARYLRWREETAFGSEASGEASGPTAEEFKDYLLWAKRFRRSR